MGLDAYVQCNCIKERKIKEPPFDIKLITYKNNVYDISEDVCDDTFHKYLKWKENACEHRGLYYINERVSNASGLNFFWSAIKKAGIELFPILKSMWNEEFMVPDLANLALAEVEILESKIIEMDGNFLIDKDTKDEFWAVLTDENNWFYSHGGEFNFNLGNQGFYITDSKGEVLFSSKDFQQEVFTNLNKGKLDCQVIYKNIADGKIFKCSKAIERCVNWERKEFYYPNKLTVITRKLVLNDFYTLKVLKKLFAASCETGNSIVWT